MTGLGSPCGACKFLRRKCVRGCVFAPYFCHEQGAAHFAAIHKVFGASNFSKLLLHVPVADRSEAAVTMAYEAQARLQDPVYGCIAHIFALQQQVVHLQTQLLSLKSQAAARGIDQTTTPQGGSLVDKLPPFLFQTGDGHQARNSPDPNCANSSQEYVSSGREEEGSSNCSMAEVEGSSWRAAAYLDMEDLQSVALAYLGRS
ncbi:LOB domain-containing protein CRL1-like isoform X1 [Zingiber officinale]|uniref:LOB domain-containing protein CRL1-like isoform X1 n=1 Tax=Zingiber officinale TaxID=94328 RepID=UPI001C4CACF8|nr:LOB domain-containing protein CRL1-like isoform X1 [Zingiber officinale]